MNTVHTLKSMTNLAIENDVDFEVWHGKSTTGSVRSHMLINMTGLPAVHLRFGDKKHGQRVSDATLSGNANVHVKYDELAAIMAENESTSDWKRSEKNDNAEENPSIASILRNAGNDKVYVRGEIFGMQKNEDGSFSLMIEATNALVIPETMEIVGSESAVFVVHVAADKIDEDMPSFEIGSETGFTGSYSYPNRINVG